MNLTSEADAVFLQLLPKLKAIAAYHKKSDPDGEAVSFYVRFKEILAGFDDGTYEKRYWSSDNKLISITENSTPKDEALFRKYLTSYLLRSFANQQKQHTKKEGRHASLDLENPDTNLSTAHHLGRIQNVDSIENPEDALHALLFGAKLDDLIEIIEADLAREEKLASSATNFVNVLFLRAVINWLSEMMSHSGSFPIIADDRKKGSEYFVRDLREGRVEAVRAELGKILANEKRFMVKKRASKLTESVPALTQKLYRYFSKMPPRLKKI